MNFRNKFSVIFFCILILVVIIISYIYKKNHIRKIQIIDTIKELKNVAEKKKIQFESIEISKDNNIIARYDDKIIYFKSDKNFLSQLNTLQKIIKSTKIEKEIKEIDFRYNKVILR